MLPTTHQLVCPHGAVPLRYGPDGALRARHAAERDARHRLIATTDCRCGWEALRVLPGGGLRRRVEGR